MDSIKGIILLQGAQVGARGWAPSL